MPRKRAHRPAYDVEMIKDFIEHLKWSLRVDHFEMTAGPDAVNPELVEQLKRYFTKRRIPRLLSLFVLERDRPELTEQQMREAMRQFAKCMAERRVKQLQHLEALQDVLKEAYAHTSGRVLEIKVPASKVSNGSWFTE